MQITINATIAISNVADAKLDTVLAQLEKFMSQIRQDVQDVITLFNTETTKISNRLDTLIANSNGLSADEKAAFQAVADHLDTLGTDPANPIPPAPTPAP